MTNTDIKHLRDVELSEPLCYQLRPFISANRDLTPLPKSYLDKEDRIPQESPCSLQNLHDTYQAIRHQKDVNWLKYKREYLSKWRGYRTHYNLS